PICVIVCAIVACESVEVMLGIVSNRGGPRGLYHRGLFQSSATPRGRAAMRHKRVATTLQRASIDR
ncbi:MAG TPA: hypothetical protein VJO99_27505, partial [Burkholderiaceae bacterium]|nr:hypothetical protein [Burkholderiaceae bacterium]